MGRGNILEVRDGLRDPSKGLGRVEGLYRRSGTGRGTSCRSGTGQGTHREVRDGLGDHQGSPGQVRGPSWR